MVKPRWTVHVLCFLWISLLLLNEYFIFWYSAKQCALSTTNHHSKVMLIADPQMTDDKSYERHWLIMALTKFYSALYMKRNYRHLNYQLKPTDTIILGDLMDNGREWQDDGFFDKEVQRFHTIFPPNNHLHYMAGNHDIGFGQRINATRVDRFEHYFGPTFYTFEKHGFLFVVLDTVSLCSNESAIPLLDNIPQHPRTLLFTHIPLYRAASQTCGPYRRQSRSNWILNEAGYQYQNLVPEHLSNLILDKVKPLLVFSGDDHDYCKVIHRDNVPEMTLPTFSMAQGVRFPGLMVLDLAQEGLSTHLCWLPDQVELFIQYGYLLIFTLVCLFPWRSGTNQPSLSKEELGITQPTTSVGLKKHVLSSLRYVACVAITTYIFCLCML